MSSLFGVSKFKLFGGMTLAYTSSVAIYLMHDEYQKKKIKKNPILDDGKPKAVDN